MGNLKIRFAKKSELEEVNVLRRQVHMVHAKGRPDIFRKKFGRKLAQHIYDFFGGELSKVVVAKSDGAIVGFASIEIIHKPRSPYNTARSYVRVTEFGVDKQHRRQGIGRALFGFIKQYAADSGFDTVELDVWEFNNGALQFYESQGFTTYRRYMEYKM
jgi:Acetyltransferases